MNIRIDHCPVCWGYRDRAVALSETLRQRFGANVEIVGGSLGQFDVSVDGKIITSKGHSLVSRLKRPPEDSEVIAAVERHRA